MKSSFAHQLISFPFPYFNQNSGKTGMSSVKMSQARTSSNSFTTMARLARTPTTVPSSTLAQDR